jgi:hypothetical protein
MNVGMAGLTDSEGGLDTFFQDLSSSTALVKVNGAGAKKKGAAPATAKEAFRNRARAEARLPQIRQRGPDGEEMDVDGSDDGVGELTTQNTIDNEEPADEEIPR